MKKLTQEQISKADAEIIEYFNISSEPVQNHIKENMVGFTAGWLARAAFVNDKNQELNEIVAFLDSDPVEEAKKYVEGLDLSTEEGKEKYIKYMQSLVDL